MSGLRANDGMAVASPAAPEARTSGAFGCAAGSSAAADRGGAGGVDGLRASVGATRATLPVRGWPAARACGDCAGSGADARGSGGATGDRTAGEAGAWRRGCAVAARPMLPCPPAGVAVAGNGCASAGRLGAGEAPDAADVSGAAGAAGAGDAGVAGSACGAARERDVAVRPGPSAAAGRVRVRFGAATLAPSAVAGVAAARRRGRFSASSSPLPGTLASAARRRFGAGAAASAGLAASGGGDGLRRRAGRGVSLSSIPPV
jgi:hypothetical protein